MPRHLISLNWNDHLIADSDEDRFEYVYRLAERASDAQRNNDAVAYAAAAREANTRLTKMERGYFQGFVDKGMEE